MSNPSMVPPSGPIREPLPQGPTPGRCVRLIDLGTQESTYQGQKKQKRKVMLSFELPDIMRKFRDDGPLEPAMISQRFTYSMDPKSTLRKFIGAWRGVPITDQEAKTYDIGKLIAASGLVNITRSADDKYDNIGGVTKLPSGLTCKEQILPSVVFSLQKEAFSQATFDKLPKGIRETIARSPEFRQVGGVYNPDGTSGGSSSAGDDQEYPF